MMELPVVIAEISNDVLSIELENAIDDLSSLDVALLCLAQRNTVDVSLMQIASPARLLCDARAACSPFPSFEAYLQDIKVTRKAFREKQVFAKDKQEGVEQ
jgi:hypothetical protein